VINKKLPEKQATTPAEDVMITKVCLEPTGRSSEANIPTHILHLCIVTLNIHLLHDVTRLSNLLMEVLKQ